MSGREENRDCLLLWNWLAETNKHWCFPLVLWNWLAKTNKHWCFQQHQMIEWWGNLEKKCPQRQHHAFFKVSEPTGWHALKVKRMEAHDQGRQSPVWVLALSLIFVCLLRLAGQLLLLPCSNCWSFAAVLGAYWLTTCRTDNRDAPVMAHTKICRKTISRSQNPKPVTSGKLSQDPCRCSRWLSSQLCSSFSPIKYAPAPCAQPFPFQDHAAGCWWWLDLILSWKESSPILPLAHVGTTQGALAKPWKGCAHKACTLSCSCLPQALCTWPPHARQVQWSINTCRLSDICMHTRTYMYTHYMMRTWLLAGRSLLAQGLGPANTLGLALDLRPLP